jgi:hypothetical protein
VLHFWATFLQTRPVTLAPLLLLRPDFVRFQGDQIVRISPIWRSLTLARFFENYRSMQCKILEYFFHGTCDYLSLTKKIGWDTSWATFSQTHLVTLFAS